MKKKRKLNKILRSALVCMLMAFCLITALPSMETEAAAITGQETSFLLINTEIGRYKLNYTGNTNHYAYWNSITGQPVTNSIYNDVGVGLNSSTATLEKTAGASGIKYAFLVWETRAPEGATTPVYFRTPDGRYHTVSPTYAVNDWRVVGGSGMNSMYCMATDVTETVRSAGYGNYSVCNIPRWYWGANGDVGGGEAPGSWQLIVVEEGENFPVRAVSLKMGAEFKLETDYASQLIFSNGIRSKSSGTATGQIFFGASNESGVSGSIAMTENISSYNDSGEFITNAVSNTTTRAGLYRNGNLVNGRDHSAGCIRMDLSDVNSNIGNNAKTLKSYIENTGWTTFFMLGTAVDIAFPDFVANQTTTVNSSSSVTVKGNIQNVSASANTGIYDGKLVVNIDSGLTVKSATAIVDGNKSITGTVSGNTVTFSGDAIKNIMKGNTITYTVECSTKDSGKSRFENSDSFSGKLRADGVNTNYWIDNACTSSSYALAKYKVTVNKGTGIKDVSGGGEYTYGESVTINAGVLPGYHWKNWTGDFNTQIQNFTFKMPARDITVTANAEANTYTLHFDPNGGGEVTPIPDMTVRYDELINLPDATDAYIKYTLDGVNVTQNVLDGTLVLDDTGVVMMMLDEESGAMMTPDGATVSADGIKSKTAEDGTTTVTYPDGNVVVISPDGIQTEIYPDGSKKVTYPDGNVENINADGTTVPSDDGAGTDATGSTGTGSTTESGQTGTTGSSGADGDNKTASVERKAVSRVATAAEGTTETDTDDDLTPAQADLIDDPDAEPQPNKKAYASVFMGWSLEEEKDTFVPQWKAGEPMDVSAIVDAAGLTETDGGVINLYAIWDDCPWIVAENLYYTLTQAQNGFITQDELLSHATAYDREDGSPIAPGVHDDGTSFTIPDYLPTDFTSFQHEGSCTENLTVTDSAGSTYWKQITVYIVDTTAVAVKPEGTTRFINEYYYNQPYENGGLEDNSIWKTDPEYVAVLQSAFDNSRNDTPIETYVFSHQDILEMKQFIEDSGFHKIQSNDILECFYNRFCALNLVQ